MKAETTARIEQYRNELPRKREKIFAAAMMLAIAIISAASATYAWVTLSASPEVTSIDTTVAANGSLEIAMANNTGAAPGRSAAGDSTGKDSNVVRANTTWGNLVNLSDPSYGLANVVLRPAALNSTTGLLTNPLYGVEYGDDGRVTGMVNGDDFAYTYYDPGATSAGGMFLVDLKGEHLGVRAISTVKYENLEGAEQMNELLSAATTSLNVAKGNYGIITNAEKDPGKSYINSLQGLIQVYAQNVIDKKPTSTLDVTMYVPDLYEMVQDVYDNVMLKTGESYVYMANLYDVLTENKHNGKWFVGTNAVEELITAYKGNKLPEGFTKAAVGFKQFVTDYQAFQTYLKKGTKDDFSDLMSDQQKKSLAYWAYQAKSGSTVYWSNINTQINWLCDISTATVDGYTLSGLSNMSTAMKVLKGDNPHSAVLHKGVIQRLEKRLGQHMKPKITITVDPAGLGTIGALAGKQTLYAIVTTDAGDPYDAPTDIDAIKKLNKGSFRGDTATAEDTHALAVDLWLRTNAGASATVTAMTENGTDTDGNRYTKTTEPLRAYLTLEGKVRIQEVSERATIKAPDGNTYDAFTGTGTVEGQKVEVVAYQKKDGKYYYIDENNTEQEIPQEMGLSYTPKMDTREVVVGYDGVNRVWSDTQMAPYEVEGATSTTQGGGSCYTFYASTEADQKRFLDLLGSMRVAFIDGEGNLIGAATMDTEHYYAENGKVTVPLALDKTSAVKLGVDKDGDAVYGLMPLVKNAATRVTAIVYLDGQKLTNQMVLASGDIQGNLNVQFGSCTAYKITTVTQTGEKDSEGNPITTTTVEYTQEGSANEPIENEPVMTETIKVSATLTGSTDVDFDPDKPHSVGVNVKVEGSADPRNVYVRFIRAISSTQGVQQDIVTLSGNGADWTGTMTFDKPGNYVLRTVWVNGVEYDLSHDPLTVAVKGASVSSLTCDAITSGSFARIMQSGSSFKTNMTLGFTTSKQTPSRVNGIFMDEDGRQVNVPFYLEGGNWKGTATFYTSGVYTMRYVEIDGEQFEISENLQPTLELQLGLKSGTRISASAETQQKLLDMAPAGMTVTPTRFVLDPSKGGKDGVTLTVTTKLYDNTGAEIKGLSGVSIYYSRVGSVTGGLDADLTWNASSNAYVGEFHIGTAGTFRFSKIVITQASDVSTITAATADTNSIQVMPPDDAQYMQGDLHTARYQYAPNKDARMTVAIAYSSAAAEVKAVIAAANGAEYTVQGALGVEDTAHMTDGITSINLWNFELPKEESTGLQEGRWTLKAITLYGVYYDGRYYDEETGVTVDVAAENITTKVVNNIVVTLSGNSQNFTGYFMDDHKVNDFTVTVADYEGQAIEAITVDNVKVSYTRGQVSLDTYGYTSDAPSPQITGTGSLKNGSATEYHISEMNFQMAGAYKSAEVTLTINGVPGTAGKVNGVVLKYMVNGKASDTCPQFDVKWTAPTVKITALDPAPNKSYKVNVGGMTPGKDITKNTHTYISPDGFYAYMTEEANYFVTITGVTWPNMTLTLSNAGSKLSSSNTAVFTVPKGKDANTPQSYTFTADNQAQKQQIGSGAETLLSGSRNEAGNQKMTTIVMNYNKVAYTLKLSNTVEIYETNKPFGTLAFEGREGVSVPASMELYYPSGHAQSYVTMPTAENFTVRESSDDSTAGSRQKVTSNPPETVYYKAGRLNYQTVTITSTIYKTPYTGKVFNVTYHVKGWIISGVNASDGAAVTVNNGNMVQPGAKVNLFVGVQYTAIPVLEELERTSAGTATTYFYQQVAEDTKPSRSYTQPDGTSFPSKDAMTQYVKAEVARQTYDIGWKDS